MFYSNVGDDAKGFFSKSAMILNILGLAYGAGVWVTISLCKIICLELGNSDRVNKEIHFQFAICKL